MKSPEFFDQIEAEAIRKGGGVKQGVVSKKELEEADEIRVSVRPPYFMGSIEMFTLRNLKPANYHLMLVAIPREDLDPDISVEPNYANRTGTPLNEG